MAVGKRVRGGVDRGVRGGKWCQGAAWPNFRITPPPPVTFTATLPGTHPSRAREARTLQHCRLGAPILSPGQGRGDWLVQLRHFVGERVDQLVDARGAPPVDQIVHVLLLRGVLVLLLLLPG